MLEDLADIERIDTTPIIGWRTWRVGRWTDQAGERHRCLVSPYMGTLWKNGHLSWSGECRCRETVEHQLKRDSCLLQRMLDEVRNGELKNTGMAHEQHLRLREKLAGRVMHAQDMLHEPDWQCACGINAFATVEQLTHGNYDMSRGVQAIGCVELTGIVRRYERGWRAEHGKIVRVWAQSPRIATAVEAAAREAGAVYEGLWDLACDPDPGMIGFRS
jgi:hypothetical protein